MRLAWMTKIVGVLMAALIGTTSMVGGVAWASADSLPGDMLYPAKRISENVRLGWASEPAARVELALALADERVAEVAALVDAGQPVPAGQAARIEQHLAVALQAASEDPVEGPLMAQIAQRTQAQVQTLAQVQAKAQNEGELDEALRVCQRTQTRAMTGAGDAEEPTEPVQNRQQRREGAPDDMDPGAEPSGPQGPADGAGEGGEPQGPQGPADDAGQGEDPQGPQGPADDAQQGGEPQGPQGPADDAQGEGEPQGPSNGSGGPADSGETDSAEPATAVTDDSPSGQQQEQNQDQGQSQDGDQDRTQDKDQTQQNDQPGDQQQEQNQEPGTGQEQDQDQEGNQIQKRDRDHEG